MCGRFTLTSNLEAIHQRFGFLAGELPSRPCYNIPSIQSVRTMVNDGQNQVRFMR